MEKRFIDADALKDKARELLPFTQNDAVWAVYNFWDLFDGIIDNATTADAAEIVRCKDCKHYDFSRVNIVITAWGTCRAIGIYTPQTHYCGFGERREDVRKPDSDDF